MRGAALDTDVVIAALDRSDAHHANAREQLQKLMERGAELLISTINYAEALVRPAAVPSALDSAVDAIASLGIQPVAPSAQTARDAARHRALGGISLADGFALATAQATDTTIASFDRRVVRAARLVPVPLAFE